MSLVYFLISPQLSIRLLVTRSCWTDTRCSGLQLQDINEEERVPPHWNWNKPTMHDRLDSSSFLVIE